MWKIKQFKTKSELNLFIELNKFNMQYSEVFINNAYGIEYRPLQNISNGTDTILNLFKRILS